jgi:hypothetical protein
LLWILALAKARSAVAISAAISAKRATQASAKINATLEGARQKGSWLRRSFVPARCGDAPHSLLAIRPSASTRDPFQYFNSLLGWLENAPSALNTNELPSKCEVSVIGRRAGAPQGGVLVNSLPSRLPRRSFGGGG